MARHRVTVTVDTETLQQVERLYHEHPYCARHKLLRAALKHGIERMDELEAEAVRRCLAAATESPHE